MQGRAAKIYSDLDREQTMPEIAASTSHTAIYGVTNAGLSPAASRRGVAVDICMIAASILTASPQPGAGLSRPSPPQESGQRFSAAAQRGHCRVQRKKRSSWPRSGRCAKNGLSFELEIVVVDYAVNPTRTSHRSHCLKTHGCGHAPTEQTPAKAPRTGPENRGTARHEFVRVPRCVDTQSFSRIPCANSFSPSPITRSARFSGHARVGKC